METLLDYTIGYGDYRMNLAQLGQIILAVILVIGLHWLIVKRLLRWYYARELVTDRNRHRTGRMVRFVLVSFLAVMILRILNIDITLFEDNIKDSATDDGPPVHLEIHISHIVKALIAFVIANVADVLVEEMLLQRYYNTASGGKNPEADARITRNLSSIQPLMYTLAVLFILRDIGLNDYWFQIFKDPSDLTAGRFTVGNLLNALAIFLAIRAGLSVMISLILAGYYRRSKVDIGSQFAINRLLTYFVYFIGVLLVIQAAGFDLLVIWTGAAALLVGIGIGLQQTFNDLICGIIILFERSVKVGDVVELTEHQVGTVRKIGTRTSIVETRDDIIIFVPNSKLIGENVTNWSHIQRVARFEVVVGVAYGSDTEKVKEILLRIARDHPKALDSPSPLVQFIDFGASSLDFRLLFWSRDFLRIEVVKSDLRFAIDKAFRDEGVEIPFPQRDLWIRGGLHPLPPKKEEE